LEIVITIFNDARIELFEEVIYEYRNDEDFRVLIERRGRNTFLNSQKTHSPLVGGISISSKKENSFGTLGGLLKTKDNKKYGLTCSHVASPNRQSVFQPAKHDAVNCRDIGQVLLASDLNFCDSQSPCNADSSKGNMDAALIEILDNEDCEYRIHELGNINKSKRLKDICKE
jgi:hypothetical protein